MDALLVHIKKSYKYNQIEFWAENGLVNIYDDRDGSTKVETISVMRTRAKALFDESSRAQNGYDKKKLIEAARDIMLCIQEAREQGDPTDARVIKDLAHANRKIWSTGASVTESGIVLGK